MSGEYIDIETLFVFEPENRGRYCNRCQAMSSDIDVFCPYCNWHILIPRWGHCFTLSMFRANGQPAEYPKDFSYISESDHYHNVNVEKAIKHSTKMARIQWSRNYYNEK